MFLFDVTSAKRHQK